MGYTDHTKRVVHKYILMNSTKSIIDVGAQNDFSYPYLPAPYISEWFRSMNIGYECIDLNGENGAVQLDLSYVIPEDGKMSSDFGKSQTNWTFSKHDMVVDAGTSEHIGRDGKFSWEAIYNCWVNKWNLLKVGGIMINENPISKSWPGHGFTYYTLEFYNELSDMIDGLLLECDIHPAMGNVHDGWNVWSVIRKMGHRFPSLSEFKTLSLKQS